MKTVGIIAEYNPFHNGHAYHIQAAKEAAGADFCVVAMSGDFVQRGEPAVFSKYARSRAALACGADLVLELPNVFATASAEDFAACGVALLSKIGVVDALCFGSECGQIEVLFQAAHALVSGGESYEQAIREGLKEGLTWPQARIRAADICQIMENDALNALQTPNNLLGIEYCKAILRQESALIPITIKREGDGYHDEELSFGNFPSATAIRRALSHSMAEEALADFVPKAALEAFSGEKPLFAEDFSALLNYALLNRAKEGTLACVEGMSPWLENRLSSLLLANEGWEGRIRQLKTRQYTYTRISRMLSHALLGIDAQMVSAARAEGFAPYARILGFRKSAAPLLSQMKEQSKISLITKTARADQTLSPVAANLLRQDFFAAHLRQSVYFSRYGIQVKNEFTQPMVIL